MITVAGGGKRVAPVEIRDAVELWARQFGGHGDVVWVGAPINVWQVRLTLKPGDPRLRSDNPDDHMEVVLLHEFVHPDREPDHPKKHKLRRGRFNELLPGYVSFDLDELGVGGIIEILDKGSLLSGRGEFESAEQAAKVTAEKYRTLRETRRSKAREEAGARARDQRRQLQQIPFHRVGIDLTTPSEETTNAD